MSAIRLAVLVLPAIVLAACATSPRDPLRESAVEMVDRVNYTLAVSSTTCTRDRASFCANRTGTRIRTNQFRDECTCVPRQELRELQNKLSIIYGR